MPQKLTGEPKRYVPIETIEQLQTRLRWAGGKFDRRTPETPGRGEGLDRAILDGCVGGAFSPGIEMTWVSRNPLLYDKPFRIRHKKEIPCPLSLGGDLAQGLEPGDFARYMACPWQADFNECSQQPIGERVFWWWPVQRPSFVHIYGEGAQNKYEPDNLVQVPWVGTDADQNAEDYVQFANDLSMVYLWKELGFVVSDKTKEDLPFVEIDRILKRHQHPNGWHDVLPDL